MENSGKSNIMKNRTRRKVTNFKKKKKHTHTHTHTLQTQKREREKKTIKKSINRRVGVVR